MEIRDYIHAVLSYDEKKGVPTIRDDNYLETQKAKVQGKQIREFIDREIEQRKKFETHNITNKQIEEVEAFLEELLYIKDQNGKHDMCYPFRYAENIFSDLHDALHFALDNDTVIDPWGHFENTTILQGLIEEIITTFSYVNIIENSMPKDRGEKIYDAAQYILSFSDDVHLHYHLNCLLEKMPDRKFQIRKVYKHFFWATVKTFKNFKSYTNSEIESFLNLLLCEIFHTHKDRITGNTSTFYLYSRPLKYFKR